MTDTEELPGIWRTLAFTLRVAGREHPAMAAGALLVVPAGWVSGTVTAYWLKLLIDGAIRGSTGRIVLATVLLVATQVGGWAAAGLGGRALQTFQQRAGVPLERRLVRVGAGLRRLEHLERPEHLDRLDPLRKEAWIVHWALEALAETLGALARLAVTVGLLAAVSPWLAFLPLAGVPTVLVARRSALRGRRMEESAGAMLRRRRHLSALASSASSAKELRVFGLPPVLRRRNDAASEEAHRYAVGAARADLLWRILAAVPLAAGFAGALLVVVADLAAGRASVGDLTLAVVLAQALNANLGAVIEMINWLVASLAVGARLVWLDDLAAAEPRGTEPAPVRLAHGLSFEHVTFRYPGTDRAVLSDVSIELPAGGVVAIVGENGAGKTTLAKLLTGMYDPSAGRIRVDDRDLAELDPSQWRRRCTGAFQDHARFELPLREAVGIGDVVRPSDDRVVLAALDAAGATDLVERLPAGLDTRLGAGWGGGADLSGGQWQKVALARAFIRTGPLLTVLDEPTAALDAATEDALFARYAAAASDARARGGVTLLISHRFSTVRMADVIVVLEHGRVVERGSHGELMRAGGAYAELYSLQARGYR